MSKLVDKIIFKLKKYLFDKNDKAIEVHEKRLLNSFKSTEEIFSHHYHNAYWSKKGKFKESISGTGSSVEYTENVRAEIPRIINKYNIQSLLDAPCGDFHWFKLINSNALSYIGGDIVKDLIDKNNKAYKDLSTNFVKLDISKDVLPRADLWLLRDCLFHFSFDLIQDTIKNFVNSDIKFLLVTSHVNKVNKDILTGAFRELNLRNAPFYFPEPLEIISDWRPPYLERYLFLYEREYLSDYAKKLQG